MPKRLNPAWTTRMHALIDGKKPVDETMASTLAKQFLIKALAEAGRPYKIHQLGCGVVRITTEVDTCPCCRQKLPSGEGG